MMHIASCIGLANLSWLLLLGNKQFNGGVECGFYKNIDISRQNR